MLARIGLTSDYDIKETKWGYVLINRLNNESVVNAKGETVLFYRVRDAEKTALELEQSYDNWKTLMDESKNLTKKIRVVLDPGYMEVLSEDSLTRWGFIKNKIFNSRKKDNNE